MKVTVEVQTYKAADLMDEAREYLEESLEGESFKEAEVKLLAEAAAKDMNHALAEYVQHVVYQAIDRDGFDYEQNLAVAFESA